MSLQDEGKYDLQAADGSHLQGRYSYEHRSGRLQDGDSGRLLGAFEVAPVSSKPLPWPRADVEMRCIDVLDSEVMGTIQQPWNSGAYFVIPARLNGTAYPNPQSIVGSVGQYKGRLAGSSRAQLAVHPAVGQFLLDSADAIDAAEELTKATRASGLRIKTVHGFLELPPAGGEGPTRAVVDQLHTLRLLIMKGVPACGLTPDLQKLSEARHSVNLIYASTVPIQDDIGAAELLFQKSVAEHMLAAQYYGAMKLAAQQGQRTKVFLMPIGTGASRNSLEMVAQGMSLAVEMLTDHDRQNLDIQALTWHGIPSEKAALSDFLFKRHKLVQGPKGREEYGPDGQRHTGMGHYKPDGTPKPLWEQELVDAMLPGGGAGHQPVEVESGGAWFRAESSRLEQERRGAQSVKAICAGVEQLWRAGLCPERRWTNDREVCNLPGLPEEVVDFPLDDTSLFAPRPSPHDSAKLGRPVVGDQVVVVRENSDGHFDSERVGTRGLMGRVVRDKGELQGLPKFEVDVGGGRKFWYEEDWLAQDRGRPRKGDKVRIYTENSSERFDAARQGTRGLVGIVVVDYGPGPAAYDIEFDDGRNLPYDDDWVARIGGTPQIGERVRIMVGNPPGHFDWHRIGTIDLKGTVVGDDGSDMPFLVHFQDGHDLYYAENWVEKVPPERLRIQVSAVEAWETMNELFGDYVLDPHQQTAGNPVWVKCADGALGHGDEWSMPGVMHVIHTDPKGRWAITRMPEEHTLAVSRPHGGRYPQLTEQWGMIRVGSFMPIDLTVTALSLAMPPAQPPPKPKKRSGCAKCGPGCGGCQDGCYHEAFCQPPAEKKEAPPPPPPLLWTADPVGEKPEPVQKPASITRGWERLLSYGPISGPGCSGACSVFDDTSHKTHCGRVFQSTLENAYFVEALNAISLRPKLARRLFYDWSIEFSVFAVRLFKNGTWLCVEVDDWVPVRDQPGEEDDHDVPFCCYSEHFPEVLWPSLVEKAYAKASTIRDHGVGGVNTGGWEALGGGGRVDEALADLTGGVASSFSTRDVAPDRLFIYLYELQRDCLFVCRVHVVHCIKRGVRLDPYSHYSVNRAAHYEGQGFVQVFCASPTGVHSAGLDVLIAPDIFATLYPERFEDGFFWLSVFDFHYYFDTIFECRLTNSPDVGLEGMPPSRLPNASAPSAGLPWKPDAKFAGPLMQPSLQPGMSMPGMPIPGTPMQPVGGTLGAVSGMPVQEPLDVQPVFFENVFAIDGLVTEHKPPEFGVELPSVPCEVVATVEQTCARIAQVGPTREPYTGILLKVYEQVDGNYYSSALICKSGWSPVRNSMVAFKSLKGGTFKIVAEMLQGEKCHRLIFRCYTSVSSASITASGAARQHVLVAPEGPPQAVKWTFVGCVPPERLERADLPMAPVEDLDTMRRNEKERGDKCAVM